MTLSTAELMSAIDAVRFNPTAIHRLALTVLEEVRNGERVIVDPTNPFMFLLESSAVNTAAAMAANEANTRKLYGSMAITDEEIYLHMSDKDYLDRFAKPSRTEITILVSREEIYAKAIATGTGGMRKLVIPRHSEFTVAGYTFTMQYPIELRVMANGGLQIIHDVSRQSPLMALSSNVVDYKVVNIDGVIYLLIQAPVLQVKVDVQYPKLISATAFNKRYNFNNNFHYARVYMANSQGQWIEMKTTHTDQVYDPMTPTAVLKVLEGQLQVQIPLVYQSAGMIDSELRVEIYTTVGPLDLILNNYEPGVYTARWLDLDSDDDGIYSAPLGQLNAISVFSDSVVTGGSPALSFEELRERVITNSLGAQQLPITNQQATSKLKNLGYNLVANIDLITNRQFLATRILPPPTDGSVISGIASTVATYQASFDDLKSHPDVRDNGFRLTITPKCLFQGNNGLYGLVPKDRVNQLLALRGTDAFLPELDQAKYLASPFYYVWDIDDDLFDCRMYHLDAPEIDSKVFVQENDTTGLIVSTASQGLEKIDDGYRLIIKTKSGEEWKALRDDQVFVQLAFTAQGETTRAYLNGTLIGRDVDTQERIYEFLIQTNYDVNAEDGLVINNFNIFGQVQNCPVALAAKFDVFYAVSDYRYLDMVSSDIDTIIGSALLPEGFVGLIHEQLNIELGHTLDSFWMNNRSVVSSIEYLTHPVDVMARYEENVYERDPVTGTVKVTILNGQPKFNILHAAGDLIKNAQGEQVYQYRAGDVVVGADGKPVPANPRGMLRQTDFFLMDGLYYFATEAAAKAYAASVPNTIVKWLEDDIEPISENLLEQTEIFFHPQITSGNTLAGVLDNFEVDLETEQTLVVRYYMTEAGYKNPELRKSLEKTAVEVIHSAFASAKVVVKDIANRIQSAAGDDVMTVSVSGLGGGTQGYDIVSLKDDAARLGIRKKLVALADGTYTVEDAVEVIFILHGN
ncbi:hypothetical protein D3C71_435860 [compost metagenome]